MGGDDFWRNSDSDIDIVFDYHAMRLGQGGKLFIRPDSKQFNIFVFDG